MIAGLETSEQVPADSSLNLLRLRLARRALAHVSPELSIKRREFIATQISSAAAT